MTNTDTQLLFSKTELYTLILLGMTSFFIGMYGFNQYFLNKQETATMSDLAYNALNLFFLQFTAKGPLPLLLDMARWMAPATLSYTLLRTIWALLSGRLTTIRMRRFHSHAVVIGLNEKSASISRYFLAKNIKTMVVDANEQNHYWGEVKKLGAYQLIANLSDKSLLSSVNIKNASYLLVSSNSDSDNLALIYEVYSQKKASNNTNMLDSVTHIQNTDLIHALNNRPIFAKDYHNLSTRLANYNKIIARLIINQFGPDVIIDQFDQLSSLHILLLSDENIVVDLIYRFAEIGIYGFDSKVKITLVGEKASLIVNEIVSRYPQIEDLIILNQLTIPRLDALQMARVLEPSDIDLVYLCQKHVDQSLLALQKIVDSSFEKPVLVCESDDATTFNWLKKEFSSYHKVIFASVNDPNALFYGAFGDQQDRLAIAIHNNYMSKQVAAGESVEKNSSLVKWIELPEVLKSANRNQADHMHIKARYLVANKEFTLADIEKSLTPKKTLALAKMEHRRWLAEKKLDGWRLTDGKKDPKKRLSPSLIDWDDLSKEEKQKDVATVEQLPELLKLMAQYD